jgi:hypothetical protein
MSFEFMTFIFLIFYIILKHIYINDFSSGSQATFVATKVAWELEKKTLICMSTFCDVDGDRS